jgi:outer membrane protein insertion porin family
LTLRRVAFVSAVLAFALAGGTPRAGAAERRIVAVLPVVVHASDSREVLQAGVADMLASRLGRAPGVAVIRVPDPGAATTDLEAAQAVARSLGAEYVLFGSFTRFGEGASLDLRCAGVNQNERDASRSIFIQSGTVAEIIPKLDALAEKVGSYVASGTLPDVAAPAVPAAADGSAARLQSLQERVEALEKRVFDAGESASVEPVPEVDLGADRP